ncbi:MAG: hypothetical protein ACK5AO_07725 [bacterium]
MIKHIREKYNNAFTKETYQRFLDELNYPYPGQIEFRVAEAPVFVDKKLGKQMIDICEYVIDLIKQEDFNSLTDNAIPESEKVPNQNAYPHFIVFDFGICKNNKGDFYPALIEMQGFPSLFGYQAYYPSILEKHFNIPKGFSRFFNDLDNDSYLQLLRDVIVGEYKKEEVILLDIKPETQKTRVDFSCTYDYLGIKSVCISKLIKQGRDLFYLNDGNKIKIKRIYNRLIADELKIAENSLGNIVDLTGDMDVEWIPHPNWFYRISKYTLPLLKHRFIPETWYLSNIERIPTDLDQYVLKPLFSFAGQGVVVDIKEQDIAKIKDPENWILQKKVSYAECIQTPTGPSKVEIRLMYIWKEGDERPTLTTNLARLSKGKMIGVRYNADKDWVGGSVAYFEQ